MMVMQLLVLRAATLLIALLSVMVSPLVQAQVPGEYRIVNGVVDNGTYLGWRVFHSTCHTCHGVGALGTAVAPNLVERVQTLTPRAFVSKVLTSYRLVAPANQANADDRAAGHRTIRTAHYRVRVTRRV